MTYYMLDENNDAVRMADPIAWTNWFQANYDKRRIGATKVGEVEVSTVFLGIDHQFGSGPPVLFETMIFGGEWDQWQWRWSTRAEALAAHDRIVRALGAGEPPEDAERDGGAS